MEDVNAMGDDTMEDEEEEFGVAPLRRNSDPDEDGDIEDNGKVDEIDDHDEADDGGEGGKGVTRKDSIGSLTEIVSTLVGITHRVCCTHTTTGERDRR